MAIAVNSISAVFQTMPAATVASASTDTANVGAMASDPVGGNVTAGDAVSGAPDGVSVFGAIVAELLPAQAQQEKTAEMPTGEPQANSTHELAQTTQAPSPADALSAEQWLQQMLGQQQVQLQARDAVPADANTILQRDISPVPLSNEQPETAAEQQGTSDTTNPTDESGAPVVAMAAAAPVVVQSVASIDNGSGAFKTGGAMIVAVDAADKFVANNADKFAVAADSKTIESSADKVTVENQSLSGQSAQSSSQMTTHLSGQPVPQISSQAAAQFAHTPINTTAQTDVGINQSQLESSLKLQSPEAKWGEQLMHALRDNVHVQLQQRIQNATIRLDPPELGSLEIFLSHESGRLTVQISASQADVARLLQNTSDRLRQDLAGPQFTEVNVQTSGDNQAGQQRSRQDARPLFAEEPVLAAAPQPTAEKQKSKKDGSGNLLVSV